MNKATVRFYLKCVDGAGKATTFRFGAADELCAFVEQSHDSGFAIVDTHMAFYDVQLLTPAFGFDVSDIDHLDVNLAQTWAVLADDDTPNCAKKAPKTPNKSSKKKKKSKNSKKVKKDKKSD